MSVFQVTANHIALIVDASLAITAEHHSLEGENRERTLRMLAEANRNSFVAMYPRENNTRSVSEFPAFEHNAIRNHGILKILKAIRCFEYQSCAHASWKDSQAERFCAELRLALIERLPGYEAAEGWGIE